VTCFRRSGISDQNFPRTIGTPRRRRSALRSGSSPWFPVAIAALPAGKIAGTYSPSGEGKFFFTMMAAFAELERDINTGRAGNNNAENSLR
jgi:hypothetical protein